MLANRVWLGASLPAWWRFRNALSAPWRAQAALLGTYLERNRETLAGRELGFEAMLAAARRSRDPLRALADLYRARVPLGTYDDIDPYVQRIRAGEAAVLTAVPVRRLVPSSGSTAARKLLPFTSDLRREFARATGPWIADLLMAHPAAAAGRAYWSISPALPVESGGAVPIGFDEDTEYLERAGRWLARATLAVPGGVCRITDVEAFRYVTLAMLLRAGNLSLISVWHPTFLERLLDPMRDWIPRIVRDIRRGMLTPPGAVAPDVAGALERQFGADPRRARDLERLAAAGRLAASDLWPRLAVVSCWADGAAAAPAHRLAQSLPGVAVQAKGLVATEAIVSIPFAGQRPLAIRSHFFEFIDDGGRCYLAHELTEGGEYTVALTTGGGLYRYRLGDRIVVDGRVRRTPSIRFVGRQDRVSDLVGEKLSEGFVAGVLARVFAGRRAPRFAMLAPGVEDGAIAYTLFVDEDPGVPDLAARLEDALRRNVHYAWCVDLGQLRPARVVQVGPGANAAYLSACAARGIRLGDIKPAVLDSRTDWPAIFQSA